MIETSIEYPKNINFDYTELNDEENPLLNENKKNDNIDNIKELLLSLLKNTKKILILLFYNIKNIFNYSKNIIQYYYNKNFK